jgi:hypothetical protein
LYVDGKRVAAAFRRGERIYAQDGSRKMNQQWHKGDLPQSHERLILSSVGYFRLEGERK